MDASTRVESQVVGPLPVVVAMLEQWDLDVSQIHYDISTVEFFGAYEDSKSLATDTGSGPSPTSVPAVLSLMERQVRRKLDGEPMYGLLPENLQTQVRNVRKSSDFLSCRDEWNSDEFRYPPI